MTARDKNGKKSHINHFQPKFLGISGSLSVVNNPEWTPGFFTVSVSIFQNICKKHSLLIFWVVSPL